MSFIFSLLPFVVSTIVIAALLRFSGIVRYIPNNRVGIVEKLWAPNGASVKAGFIALEGQPGFQPDILRGGFHFFVPFMFRVHTVPLVTITQGKIGYIFARDGKPLEPGQTLASNKSVSNFDDVRTFLANGGQKGPQRKMLREGTYALNLAQFVVLTDGHIYALELDSSEEELFKHMGQTLAQRGGFEPVVIKDQQDQVGIVTVHDARSLPSGEIIAPEVGTDVGGADFHNNFQDPDVFVEHGFRGRQLQVLVDGTYYINRLFATVELIAKTVVPVGSVGVVVSYTGKQGTDRSESTYRHGELVDKGFRGVWAEPLMPGKYAFNTYAGQVMLVPTTNFILKWSSDVTAEHKFDQNLKEVSLITKDAFEPSLPLSVVVHIDYKKAPLVVQRFGDIKKLVEQTLDPMVSAYFKNIAQTKTLIELLQERSDIQRTSSEEMREKFGGYSLELQEVLIGTPRSPEGNSGIEEILKQLRDRQVAKEQVNTYQLQEQAAKQERTLREAEATAQAQGDITRSALQVTVKENEGKADVAYATQAAQRVGIDAKAEAERLKTTGEGEAARIEQIGSAEAKATKSKVDAFGGPQFQLSKEVAEMFANAIREGRIPMVPQIQMGESGKGGNMADAIMAMVLQGGLKLPAPATTGAPEKAAA